MTQNSIGPDDRPDSLSGSWELKDGTQLELRPADPNAPTAVMRLLHIGPDKLVIEK